MRHLLPALLTMAALASAQTPELAQHGGYSGDQFGAALAVGDDADGDGVPELLVGAPALPGTPGAPGYAISLSGATGLKQARFAPAPLDGDRFGAAIVASTDLDGDGLRDVLVGNPGTGTTPTIGGTVSFYSSADGHLITILQLASGDPWDGLGLALADLGDVDGDGLTDWAAGRPSLSGQQPGSVFFGRSAVPFAFKLAATGDESGDEFGFALAALGDVDLDGTPDALVGAPGGGYVRVISGTDGSTLLTVPGGASSFARVVASAGDNNGDGVPDLAVGSPEFSRVEIFSGASGALLRRFEKLGGAFGSAIAPLGDADDVGVPDLLVGAPADTVLQNAEAGAAYVVSGTSGKNLFKLTGGAAGAHLGAAVAAADLDGDDRPEMLVGAPGTDPATGSVELFAGKLAGSIVDYGLGCPGSFIITPRLDVFGDPLPGGRLTLAVTKALGGAPAIIALGSSQAVLPLKNGCILWMDPLLVSVPFVLDGDAPGAGNKTFTGEVPLDAPLGLLITMQVLIADSGAAEGIAGTSAFAVTVQ
jgi:hypothetical protein